MTAISASLVKELRERTGAGMMECKKALVEVSGDIDAAVELMRKKGQTKADKKASRTAAEGLVQIIASETAATMVEINCETDFVARDSHFVDFAKLVAQTAQSADQTDVAVLSEASVEGQTLDQIRRGLISKLGENITIRRAANVTATTAVGTYTHNGRIGVAVCLSGGDATLAKDIAMHIAASSPVVVSQTDVPADLVEKERAIFAAQAADSGKPEEIVAKMTEGRVRKFLDEVSLLGQPFVKDPSKKVADILKAAGATVEGFTRYLVGEGIEKEAVDFAKEVMEQAQG